MLDFFMSIFIINWKKVCMDPSMPYKSYIVVLYRMSKTDLLVLLQS